MNIDTMPAGREMGALVAEKVMGLSVEQSAGDFWCVVPPVETPQKVPKYSTDIAAAWEVLGKAFPVGPDDKSGFPMIMHRDDGWIVTMAYRDGTPMGVVGGGRLILSKADTAPLAICRAALKVVGL